MKLLVPTSGGYTTAYPPGVDLKYPQSLDKQATPFSTLWTRLQTLAVTMATYNHPMTTMDSIALLLLVDACFT
jgi:hypothetical protein